MRPPVKLSYRSAISTKKWFLGPDQFGPCHKSKEKLGEIRSLLEAPYTPAKSILTIIIYGLPLLFVKKIVQPTLVVLSNYYIKVVSK